MFYPIRLFSHLGSVLMVQSRICRSFYVLFAELLLILFPLIKLAMHACSSSAILRKRSMIMLFVVTGFKNFDEPTEIIC